MSYKTQLPPRPKQPCFKLQNETHIHENLLHQTVGILHDLDTEPLLFRKITANLSACSPQIVAVLRSWQRAAYVLACIDTAISYISKSSSENVDPIRDAVMNTILSLAPLPGRSPTRPQPDDRERVMDRRVLFDEPQMQALIESLDEESRIQMKAAADRERSHLPLFPAHFWNWDELTVATPGGVPS